ncbi:MAG TPA: isochorismatase family cysteine hydrolase [Galbitalea sp.]|jgi:nicotinamidase-related amidase|nr:isochorismatase family cysteine hydrolase [Galbitalea sp.]
MTLSGGDPVLVVIDMQVVFGDPTSQWFTPGYPLIEPTVAALVAAFDDRVVFTRFFAPEHPVGAWIPYYELWPFALVPADDPLYDLTPGMDAKRRQVVSETTFGKWGPELGAAIGESTELVLVGVSTDCCVLSTALAAADAGIHVRVVGDACAGLSDADHQRALDAMALYAPLIEIVDSASVLKSGE